MSAQATIDFPGWDGFLGTRASLMMDVVVVAMVAVLALLMVSIQLVRHGHFLAHKRIQLTLAAALLVTVFAFEIDVRLNGWRERAAGSVGGSPEGSVFYMLYVHLFFAITSVVLWPVVVIRGLKRFPTPPVPNEHSTSHRRWAKLASWDMALTAVTGWIFYWMAFIR